MTIRIPIPDFDGLVNEVTQEIKARVEARTPRSKLNKAHLQDQWDLVEDGDGKVHIVNNFPYAIFVEEGTSKMEGRFMVRTTMEEVPEIIAQAWENAKQKSN